MFSVPKRHSDTYRHNLITIIKGAVEWAAKMGYIDHSPIAKLMKPTPAVRQDFVTAVRWPDVLAVTTDQPLKDFRVAQLPPLPAVALRR